MNTRRSSGGGLRRRLTVAGLVGMGAAVLIGSFAWACTAPRGYTWYADGSITKSGPSPVNLSAFATGATPNRSFYLVASNNVQDPTHDPTHVCMDTPQYINSSLRYSNSRGVIATTNGWLDRPQGEWQICFAEPNLASATYPVYYTVL